MTETANMNIAELQELHIRTIKLREEVLQWAKDSGYSATELVSRTAEHEIEMFYGRMVLSDKQ